MNLFDLPFRDNDFAKQENEYKNFYAPAFSVEVNGENLVKKGIEVNDVNVIDSLNAAGSFSFTVNNAFDPIKKDFNWVDELLAPGRDVSIRMGYTDRMKLMISGKIVSIKATFPLEGNPQLQLSGKDFLDSMMKDSRPDTWQNVTHSQVVEDIITRKYKGKYNIKEIKTDDTKIQYKTISQNQKSDFQFVKDLAEENNFEFFARGDTFFFRERPKSNDPGVTLEWGKNLLSFSPEVNLAGQVGEVIITGWDHRKKLIKGKSKDLGSFSSGRKSGRDIIKESYGSNSVMHRQLAVESQDEADLKAEALQKQAENKLVTGSGESIGLPEIRTGMYIGLKGLGKKFSKSYYLVYTEHSISSSGYYTNFYVEVDNI